MSETDRARKSSIISALVHQMKSGEISKSDLFEQLSRLQRGAKVEEPIGLSTVAIGQRSPSFPSTPTLPFTRKRGAGGGEDAKSRPLSTPSPPPAFHSQSYAAAPIKMPTAGRMSRITSSASRTNSVSSTRGTIGGSGGGESPSVAEVVVGGGGAVGFPGFLRLDDDSDDEDL